MNWLDFPLAHFNSESPPPSISKMRFVLFPLLEEAALLTLPARYISLESGEGRAEAVAVSSPVGTRTEQVGARAM